MLFILLSSHTSILHDLVGLQYRTVGIYAPSFFAALTTSAHASFSFSAFSGF
jgi:hypothetical protein